MFRRSSTLFYIPRNFNWRRFNTSAATSRRGFLTRRTFARTLGAFAFGSLAWVSTTGFADGGGDGDLADLHDNPQYAEVPFSSLVRAYVVFSMCSIPWLVDASPRILKTFSSIPIVREVTEGFLRITFFKQFVGADTVDDCIPVLHALRNANQGVVFAYSVEERSIEHHNNGSETHAEVILKHRNHAVRDLLHSIDVAAEFEDHYSKMDPESRSNPGGRSTWVAIKMSTLLPEPYALVVLSKCIVDARERSAMGSTTDDDAINQVAFPSAPRLQDFDFLFHNPRDYMTLSSNAKDARSHIRNLRDLYSDLVAICTRARDRGITLTIDAEESWYQPAIDLFTLGLMREFNGLGSATGPKSQSTRSGSHRPVLYLTVQAYLRRTPAFLRFILEDAKTNRYALGVKLVRGAYWEAETALHSQAVGQPPNGTDTGAYIKPDSVHEPSEFPSHTSDSKSVCLSNEPLPPVWLAKHETDRTYDECVKILLKEVKEDMETCRAHPDCKPQQAHVSVYLGTHNWKSARLVLEEMVRNGLGEVVGRDNDDVGLGNNVVDLEGDFVVRMDEDLVQRVTMGQLYGMSDELSEWLVSHTLTPTPFVIRYLPYGPLRHVMPYLSRRAIENKSVLGTGGAQVERNRAAKEICTRVRRFFA